MATDILYSNTALLVFRLLRHALMNGVGALKRIITAAVTGDRQEKAKQKVSFCSQMS